jgi:predicted nucleic acid-binding protein
MIEHFERCADKALLVSVLAALEVRSAVRRREALGDISPNDAQQVIHTLLLETGRLVELPITAPIVAQANSIIDTHRLKALDAVQLASAIVVSQSLSAPQDLGFVTSDKRLAEAAQKENLATWNPELSPSLKP